MRFETFEKLVLLAIFIGFLFTSSGCTTVPLKKDVSFILYQQAPKPDLEKPIDWGLAEGRYSD